MLQNFITKNVPCLGVEPSKNVANVARDKGIEVVTEFFDKTLAENIISTHEKADGGKCLENFQRFGSDYNGKVNKAVKPGDYTVPSKDANTLGKF